LELHCDCTVNHNPNPRAVYARIQFGNGTPVVTKAIAAQNPSWDTELWLPFLFPTFGELLKVDGFTYLY
jgi:hypothetical protein